MEYSYIYAENNPTCYFDSDGLEPISLKKKEKDKKTDYDKWLNYCNLACKGVGLIDPTGMSAFCEVYCDAAAILKCKAIKLEECWGLLPKCQQKCGEMDQACLQNCDKGDKLCKEAAEGKGKKIK